MPSTREAHARSGSDDHRSGSAADHVQQTPASGYPPHRDTLPDSGDAGAVLAAADPLDPATDGVDLFNGPENYTHEERLSRARSLRLMLQASEQRHRDARRRQRRKPVAVGERVSCVDPRLFKGYGIVIDTNYIEGRARVQPEDSTAEVLWVSFGQLLSNDD